MCRIWLLDSNRGWTLKIVSTLLLILLPAFVLAEKNSLILPGLLDKQSIDVLGEKNAIVLVDFWASWCGPCRKSLPAYNQIFQEYSAKGFKIFAISMDEIREDAVDFVSGESLSYSLLYDGKGISADKFDITGMPTSFLLDRNGQIRHSYQGFKLSHVAQLKKDIELMLNEE